MPQNDLRDRIRNVLMEPFDWCRVTGGDVTLVYRDWIDGKYQIYDKKQMRVDPFWMAKYPITNAQFRVFVDAKDGFRNVEWWKFSIRARTWRTNISQPFPTGYKRDDVARSWTSWYEAMAFCYWLSAKTGIMLTLPTEQQWQRAAVGDTDWVYPWGNEIDKTYCNYRGSNINQPTHVTKYEANISPYGVCDMAGNVWEWTRTAWHNKEDDNMIVRGGSFNGVDALLNTNYRGWDVMSDGQKDIGFRVCTEGKLIT